MKKVVCDAENCANKNINYYMPIEDQKVLCGGCKNWIDAHTMTKAEIEITFDYELNPPQNYAETL